MKIIKEKIKPGMIVTVYDSLSRNRASAREYTVTKVGRSYIHVERDYSQLKFDIKGLYGEYGKALYLGTVQEFLTWTDTCKRGRQVINDLEKSIPRLTADDLDVLEKFIKLDE